MQAHHSRVFGLRVSVMIIGGLSIIAGVFLAFLDLRTEGSMSFKSPLLEGAVTGTDFGLFLVFCGCTLVLVALLKRQTVTTTTDVTEQSVRANVEAEKKPSETKVPSSAPSSSQDVTKRILRNMRPDLLGATEEGSAAELKIRREYKKVKDQGMLGDPD